MKFEIDEMKKTLELMFISIDEKTLLKYYTIYLITLFVVAVFLLFPILAAGILMGSVMVGAGWTAPRIMINIMHKQRVKKFVVQMVEGLALMSNGMRS